jgi:putative effector of murein hydrolase LrgA (UPF0299 family)
MNRPAKLESLLLAGLLVADLALMFAPPCVALVAISGALA